MLVKPTVLMSTRVFELPEMAKILDIPFAKAKNWTNERTGLVIKPSVRPAGGTGKSGLYSVQDLYLMAIAREFSKAGFAANAIGKLTEAAIPRLKESIRADSVWTIWRQRPGGPFQIETGYTRPAKGLFWHTLEIGPLLKSVDGEAQAFSLRRERELKARKRKRERVKKSGN
jgi:hypothetical protein